MKKKVLMIVNPISGDKDKSEMVSITKEFSETKNYEFLVHETTGENDIQTIHDLCLKENPNRVIIAGGDGTVKMVAEALEDCDVIFGIIPAGSANGLSVDLNLPASIEENLEIAFADKIMNIDMICINDKKSLHLSDLGLNAQLVKNYENSNTRGMIGYALQAITTLSEQEEPFTATVETNGQTIETVARMIVVANSQKYGTGVTINPTGVMNDGKFEIVILKNLDLVVFGKIISGNMPADGEDVEIISTDKAIIKTNTPVSFQIDGEYIGLEQALNIYILPGQMKVTIP